jgi:hypothetical protein
MFHKSFRISAPILLACLAIPVFGQGVPVGTGSTPLQVLNGSYTLVGPYDPTQMLRLVLGLQPPNLAEEEQFLKELQTKGSPNFHQFLTADEWNAMFAPAAQDEQAVVDWANSQGLTVTKRFPNRLTVDLQGSVATIEKAFGIKINAYQSGAQNFYSNDRDPVIPASLSKIVHSVGGLNNIQVLSPAHKGMLEPAFPIYSAGDVSSMGGSGGGNSTAKPPSQSNKKGPISNITNGAYDPTDLYDSNANDLNALYQFGHCCNPLGNAGGTPPETSIAIATAGTQQPSDFQGFHNQYPYLAWHYFLINVDGTPSCCDIEGTMDFEWSTAWSNSFGAEDNTSSVFMYDGVNNQFSTFTDAYQAILNDGNARTFSTSWGCEELYCTPQSSMDTDHAIFNNMVGLGWTLIGDAGDQGATAGCAVFNIADGVQYPASDPNVIGAGGTTLSLFAGPIFNYQDAWSGGPDGCSSNDGGSTGGLSAYYGVPSYQSTLGFSNRAVPDIALNADWYHTPQNIYFEGGLSGNGGTSIVAPEMAGFFAQSEAYLLYLSSVISGGLCNGHGCGPLGNGNYYLYYFGENPHYAPHYPFYDVTSGCNDNNITSAHDLGYYCAGPGYDQVTGWGAINALQLAWAINAYNAGDFGAPVANFSGPSTGVWYNTDQTVLFTLTDTSGDGLPLVGVSGYSQLWDADPGDVISEPTPGSGNSFYSGPQLPNSSAGSFDLAAAGQGCHTANVRGWDNSGSTSDQTSGLYCYDNIAPITTATLSGTLDGTVYVSPVKVTLTATDSGSGIAHTYYKVDSAAQVTYSAPFTVSATGAHTVTFHSVDVAGNVEATNTVTFTIRDASSTSLVSSANPSGYGHSVTFTATVTSGAGTPPGTVVFYNGTTAIGSGTLSSGQASFTTATMAAGTHSITAGYLGYPPYAPSTSAILSQVVNQAATSTSLTSSLNPAPYMKAVTFTATVTSPGLTPVGYVKLMNGTTLIGEVELSSGKAAFTKSALQVGLQSITAVYIGNVNFKTSTSAVLDQTINKAGTTTSLTSSLNPSTSGSSVTFTAVVKANTAGTPGGSVTFKDGTTVLGVRALSSGEAAFTTTSLAVGSHSITAVYGAGTNYLGSTSPVLTQQVNQ